MKRQARLASPWLIALALALGAGAAHAQGPEGPSLDRVRDLFAQARPHLEAVLGARFDERLEVRLATVEQVRQLPDYDLEAFLRLRFPDLSGEALQQARDAAREAAARCAVARHVEGSSLILLLPQQQKAIAAADESLKGASSDAFLQLALVHEAARCVLESRYQTPKLRGATRDAEECLALQAVVEGRAHWATAQVAKRLRSENVFPLLARRYLFAPDPSPDPRLRTVAQTAVRQRHWACTQGMALFAHMEEKGIKDAEEAAFRTPPRQLRRVEEPQLYLRALAEKRPPLADVLRSVDGGEASRTKGWKQSQQPWSPEMVLQVAGLLGVRESAGRAVAGWDEGRTLVWSFVGRDAKQVALSVVRMQTASAARTYYGFAVDAQRKRDALPPSACVGMFCVLKSESSALKLPGAEEAVRYDKQVRFGDQGQPLPATVVLCRAGDLVVEFNWHGAEPDLQWAASALSAVLAPPAR